MVVRVNQSGSDYATSEIKILGLLGFRSSWIVAHISYEAIPCNEKSRVRSFAIHRVDPVGFYDYLQEVDL